MTPFGLNADFFAMSLDCDSGTNILWMHLKCHEATFEQALD